LQESLSGAKGYTTIRLAALKDGLYKGIDERSSADYFASGWRYGKRAGRDADAGFLWDFWYPAVRSSVIRGTGWLRLCCWRCAGFGRTAEGGLLLCGILVRTGIPLSYGTLMGGPWSAVITDGGLMLARRGAWRFLR